MKHIILEGIDGVGKTTYVERLLKSDNKVKMLHFGKPEGDGSGQFEMYANTILECVPFNGTIVWDRSFYSDLVYGPVMRNRCDISIAQLRALESMIIRDDGGMIMYLTAPVNTCWARCQKRGENYIGKKEILADLHKAYEEFFPSGASLPVFRIDTSK